MFRYPDRERSRTVLIGTTDYERTSLSALPAIHNNLTALEAALTNSMSGVFASEHCLVVDNPDTPRSMITRLARSANEAEDVLFVYYAGHGVLSSNGDLHLTARETDPDQLAGTAVPFEWVRNAIRESPAIIRILILDCCFSGRAVGTMSSDSAALNQLDVAGTYILASTTANRVSISVPGERFTAFTGEFIRLLTIQDSGPLLLRDFYRPLSAAMAKRGLPRPTCSAVDAIGELAVRRPPFAAPPRIEQTNGPPTGLAIDHISPPLPRHETGPNPVSHAKSTANVSGFPVEVTPPYLNRPRLDVSKHRRPNLRVNPLRQSVTMKQATKIAGLLLTSCLALLFFASLIVGIVQVSAGHSANKNLGAAIFAIVFIALVTLGCIEILFKIIRGRGRFLTINAFRWVAAQASSFGHSNAAIRRRRADSQASDNAPVP